jgi:6-phosphogluconate dehydrogenase
VVNEMLKTQRKGAKTQRRRVTEHRFATLPLCVLCVWMFVFTMLLTNTEKELFVMNMELAMVGLGKMGANMMTRLLRGGHRLVAYDLSEEAIKRAEGQGAEGARSWAELAGQLPAPRIVWLMVPAGEPTEQTILAVAEHLSPGDVIIDGGNSNYKDSMRRAQMLADRGIHFVDVGTSGGIWGLTEGYSLMVGGKQEVVAMLRPIFETLAPGGGL